MKQSSTDKVQIRREIHQICRLRSMALSRGAVILLLVLFIYPVGAIPAYLAAFFLLFPIALASVITPPKEGENHALLPHTKRQYHFSSIHYRKETLFAPAIVFFLAIWQVTILRAGSFLHWRQCIPVMLLMAYLICRICIYCYYRLLLRYNFTHLNF